MKLQRTTYFIVLLFLLITLTGCKDKERVEVLRDDWGIPHIYAEKDVQLAYGLAWSQMENHGNLILKLYARSSGKSAELWGRDRLESDRHVWNMGIPQLAVKHYARLEGSQRKVMDAFASGITQYVEQHTTEFDAELKQLLPITGQDVTQHIAYTLYMPNQQFLGGIIQQYVQSGTRSAAINSAPMLASNGWVLGPKKTTSGKPILLSNTHFPWPNFNGYEQYVWHEAHMVGEDIDIYGIGLIGVPAITLGFNDTKAWTVTATGTFDKLDTYELSLVENGYLYDGKVKTFDTQNQLIKIKEPDGSLSEERLTLRQSVHGPVIYEANGNALAIRFATPDNVAGTDLWDMARADSPDEFLQAMEDQNLLPLNILYADNSGNILYTIAGVLPDRSKIDVDSTGIIPGNTSSTLWHGNVPFNRIPKVLNPETGYLQNSNQPPWSATLPSVLDPDDFPKDWPEPRVFLRAASSIKMLTEKTQLSFDDVVHDKYSTHSELAERVLDDLIQIGQTSNKPLVQQAVTVLSNWDRNYNQDSIGAVLFTFWAMQLSPQILQGLAFPEHLYATPYNNDLPLMTPSGLVDAQGSLVALETAANIVNQYFGSLYVSWGAFFRFQLDNKNIPGYGAPGSFGVFSANRGIPQNGPLTTIFGDSWVFVIDYANPENAKAVMSYSNATQAGSTHVSDQLGIYANKQLRDIYRSSELITAHLESREVIHYSEE
jgi:acyl-homoserine-lactone acylase